VFTDGNGTGGAPLSAGFFGGQSSQQVIGARPNPDGDTLSFTFTPLTSVSHFLSKDFTGFCRLFLHVTSLVVFGNESVT
jgi:hypothetical protein